jgi:hypothetical protein
MLRCGERWFVSGLIMLESEQQDPRPIVGSLVPPERLRIPLFVCTVPLSLDEPGGLVNWVF